jgi:hypothetical protein
MYFSVSEAELDTQCTCDKYVFQIRIVHLGSDVDSVCRSEPLSNQHAANAETVCRSEVLTSIPYHGRCSAEMFGSRQKLVRC